VSAHRSFFRSAIVLIGLLSLLIGYYWTHKPFSFALIQSVGGAVLDILTVAAIVIVTGGVGRQVLARLDLCALSTAERVALESVLGLGITSWIALFLGMLGLFHGLVLWIMLAVTALLCWRDVIGWTRSWGQLRAQLMRPGSRWGTFLTLLLVILLLLALLPTLAPPYSWDALTYHLVGPAHYLAANRIAAHADNPFMGFPQSVELLYGITMSLFGRDTTAALIHFWFGILALLATAGITRRYTNATTARLVPVLLVSAFNVWSLFREPLIDLATMAYGALALSVVAVWSETRRPGWLMLLGLLAGLVVGVKYTAVSLPFALTVYIVWQTRHLGRIVRDGLIFGTFALLAFLPWMFKGIMLYGNPVYPFIFGGMNWDAQKSQAFSGAGTGLLGTVDAWQLPVLPLAATIFGTDAGSGYGFTLGPWLFTVPFLLLICWIYLPARARQLARLCVGLGLPLLLFWAALAAYTGLGRQTRLMVVTLPVAAVASGLGFYGLSLMPRKPLDTWFIVRGVLVVTLILGVIDTLRESATALPYLLGNVSRGEYLFTRPRIGTYASVMEHFGTLPPASRVLMMWEPRSYPCPVTCLPDILFDHWAHPLHSGRTPDNTFDDWKRDGIDYLLLWKPGYDFTITEEMASFAENKLFLPTLERWMMPVWTDGVAYTLYRWKTQDASY
jgi:hypothetical protein